MQPNDRIEAPDRSAQAVVTSVPGGVPVARRFEQEPGAPFGFIDPHFDQAGGGDIVMFVANVMRFAKPLREHFVVFA